jgi:hypothetical protein
MINEMNSVEDGNIFRVKSDGTIERIENAGLLNSERSALDKELLDIIEVNSYSKEILAACKARKIANKISKQKYGKQNYKEYVEMLMVKHFPKELEKARLGGKYLFWLWFSIILTLISFGFGIPISAVLVWFLVIPAYKSIKKSSKCNV